LQRREPVELELQRLVLVLDLGAAFLQPRGLVAEADHLEVLVGEEREEEADRQADQDDRDEVTQTLAVALPNDVDVVDGFLLRVHAATRSQGTRVKICLHARRRKPSPRTHAPRSTPPELPSPHSHPPFPNLHPCSLAPARTFSATRSFALRDRGLRSISSSVAVTGRCVSTVTIFFAPHAHTGSPGGHVHSPWSRRSARLTMRSSSEWNEITATRAPGSRTLTASSTKRSSPTSSSFATMRMAWNVSVAGSMSCGLARLTLFTIAASCVVVSTGRASTMARAIRRALGSSP